MDNSNRMNGNSPANKSQKASAARDKYLKLAQEARVMGDRVAEQHYLQFADHYVRLMIEAGDKVSDVIIHTQTTKPHHQPHSRSKPYNKDHSRGKNFKMVNNSKNNHHPRPKVNNQPKPTQQPDTQEKAKELVLETV